MDTLKEHHEALRDADRRAVELALSAAKEAVSVAEVNADRWRASANEWRGAMSDRERDFMSRREFRATLIAFGGFVSLGLGVVVAIVK